MFAMKISTVSSLDRGRGRLRYRTSLIASSIGGRQRRSFPGYPFVAVAHIEEIPSQTELVAHTVTISLWGCLVDVHCPLPAGAPVCVTISNDGTIFRSLGNVVVAVANVGMRLSFETLAPEQEEILRIWVDGAKQMSGNAPRVRSPFFLPAR